MADVLSQLLLDFFNGGLLVLLSIVG